LALKGINRGKDTLTGQRSECNEETGQQDSENAEHSNLEQQIQRSYTGLWKKANNVERRLQLGTGSCGSSSSSSSSSNNKNNIHHSKKKSLNKVG
jgi:hypothetical protein